MIPLGGDSWTIHTGGDPDINFCVWVLLHDGLRVGPFDRHDNGDGQLQAIGLTVSAWRDWFQTVVRDAVKRQASPDVVNQSAHINGIDLAGLFYDDEPPTADQILSARQLLLAKSAAARWPRPDQIQERLLKLWPQYMHHMRDTANRDFAASVRNYQILEKSPPEEAEKVVERSRRFWAEIQRFRPLPPVQLFTVDYPVPVVEVFPPSGAVLGGINADEESEDYYRLVREALKRLRDSTALTSSG